MLLILMVSTIRGRSRWRPAVGRISAKSVEFSVTRPGPANEARLTYSEVMLSGPNADDLMKNTHNRLKGKTLTGPRPKPDQDKVDEPRIPPSIKTR